MWLLAAGKRAVGHNTIALSQGTQVEPSPSIAHCFFCICYATGWLQLKAGICSMWARAICISNRVCLWRCKCSQHGDR